MTLLGSLLLASVWTVSAPKPIVLNCFLTQSTSLELGQFIRQLRINPKRRVVSISDSLRGGRLRYLGDGALIELSDERIVFDYRSYASSGRTVIDRLTDQFLYDDGRNTISGTCHLGDV